MEKAIASFNKVLEADPDSIWANYNLGIIYASKNDLIKSKEKFLKVVDLNPNLVNAHYYLALIYDNPTAVLRMQTCNVIIQ